MHNRVFSPPSVSRTLGPQMLSSRPSPVWNTRRRIFSQGLPRLRTSSLLLGPIAAAVLLDWHHLVDACSSERVCQPSLKLAGQQGPCLPEEALSPVNLACMIPAYPYSRFRVDRGQKAARGNKQIFVRPVKSTAAEERLNPRTWGETADNTTKHRWLLPVKTLSRIQSRLLLWAGLLVNWTPTYRLRCWCVCVCEILLQHEPAPSHTKLDNT